MAKMEWSEYSKKHPDATVEDFVNYTKSGTDSGSSYDEAMAGVEETPAVDYQAMMSSVMDMYSQMSDANKEKFDEYWPKSISEGIAAGKQFDTAGQEASTKSTAYNMALADQMNNWLGNMTKYGNQFMRGEAGAMNQWMEGQVQDVNKFNSEEFYNALEKALPGIMDTAGQYKNTVDQMLSGKLPEDVQKQITQVAAERGLAQGVYGPAYGAASAQSMGMNSLAMVQAGQAQMPNLTTMAKGLMAPVATPNIYQNVMMTPTPYTPQPSYSTPSNIAGISGNYLSAVMGSTMMQPQAGVSAGLQAGQIQSQINQSNTQLQYAQAQGSLQWQNQQQMYSLYQQQLAAQQQQSQYNLFGSLAGAGAQLGGAYLSGGGTTGIGSLLSGLFSNGGGGSGGSNSFIPSYSSPMSTG